MADSISVAEISPMIMSSIGSSSTEFDDNFDDACSICLDPFNCDDPATITSCKHEYHLQCILEWSQRSKECPICWQLLVLQDPASQELLAAVESERTLRARGNARLIHENYETNHDASSTDDSDVEEHIMQHFAVAASRARYVGRRGGQRSFGFDHPQVIFVPSSEVPNVEQRDISTPDERRSFNNGLLEDCLPTSRTSISRPNIDDQNQSSEVPSIGNVVPNNGGDRDSPAKPRGIFGQLSPDSPQKKSSSEFLTFSESIKSRFAAASVKYKESLTKSTQGVKEKLLARNISVKELGRGVQRDMTAGISRMMERIDLTSKRNGGASNFSPKGKGVQESVTSQARNGHIGETTNYNEK